eukprot:CAMPEP_0182884628 /NCGR_PEP_ID=MMETSP0034_2-20130328/19117_1 /TAXON_ID=156128 /ORGANISM="Nephroselmis pyriformis, Strain CCMP717" /LENGTH=96 /DNA_ID=CAMNT_0025017841 /DNA_START=81 /DNA_END=367 /DNA_ORIENTATION=-
MYMWPRSSLSRPDPWRPDDSAGLKRYRAASQMPVQRVTLGCMAIAAFLFALQGSVPVATAQSIEHHPSELGHRFVLEPQVCQESALVQEGSTLTSP